MKKIMSILLCIMFCSMFSSCMNLQGNRINKLREISIRDERIAEQTLEEILTRLEKKEKAEFKEMFSENALDEIADMDQRIDFLFDYYKGVHTSYSEAGFGQMSESSEGILKIMKEYDIKTNEGEYILRFEVTAKDTEPEKVGINMIQICTENDKETMIGGIDAVGLYIPGYQEK